jgi:hypothetical protein
MTVIVVILSTFPSFVQFVTQKNSWQNSTLSTALILRLLGLASHPSWSISSLQLLSSDYLALLAIPVGQFQNLCLQRSNAITLAFEFFLSRAQLVIKQVYASFRQFPFRLIFVLIKLRA